ncbi:hypothetical protein PM082_006221 [Marasmius tenuissimus]|nr:hypothetical protein PM082_006221 [Marasmius tenuissimus]
MRDQNVNTGLGNLTVNNQTFQQTRSRSRYIRGTEEEEAEYEEYGEYKRGDIELLERIHHEARVFDRRRGCHIECERSIFVGKVLTGEGKGAIVTVESYQGREAPAKWKESFASYSVHLYVNNAQLVALNRSKVPLLIFSGGLVPIAYLRRRNSGWLAEVYFTNLRRHYFDVARGKDRCRWAIKHGSFLHLGDRTFPSTTVPRLPRQEHSRQHYTVTLTIPTTLGRAILRSRTVTSCRHACNQGGARMNRSHSRPSSATREF